MPLGVLTEIEARSELTRFGLESHLSETNVINFTEIKRGRGNKEETPISVRAFIASEAISGTPTKELAEQFNISPSSIAAYKKGAASTASYNEPDPVLSAMNDNVRARIIGPAQKRIIDAINSITADKLNESKARDAASIASSLSMVIKNISPDEREGQKTQINIFAPRKNEEEDYEIIQVQS